MRTRIFSIIALIVTLVAASACSNSSAAPTVTKQQITVPEPQPGRVDANGHPLTADGLPSGWWDFAINVSESQGIPCDWNAVPYCGGKGTAAACVQHGYGDGTPGGFHVTRSEWQCFPSSSFPSGGK